MENKRPTLNDPAEFAIIKKIYFKNDRYSFEEELDPLEKLDRLNSRLKNNNKSAR